MATVISVIGILTFLIALGSTLLGVMRWLKAERGNGEAKDSDAPDGPIQVRRARGPRVLALTAVLLFSFAVVTSAIWMRTDRGRLADPPTASPMPPSLSAAPTSNPSLPTDAWSPIAEQGSGGFGSWLLILLGGVSVAVGVGTIVLLYSRRRNEPGKEANATRETDGGRGVHVASSSADRAGGHKSTQSDGNQNSSLERAKELLQAGRTDEAIHELEILRETRRRVLGLDDPGALIALHELIYSYRQAGRLEEAIALLQEMVSYKNPFLDSPEPLKERATWNAHDPDGSV